MRVLHLINAFQPGGIETWLLRMLAEIPRREVAMDFCCKGVDTGLRADVARHYGASVMHCPLRVTHAEFVGGLLKLLQHGNYDLVHSHLDVTGGPAVWAARQVDMPIISSFHNTHFAPQTWTRLPGVRQLRDIYSRLSIGYSLKHSTMITGCSRAVLDHVVTENAADDRCRILYYGVETHARAGAEDRAAFRQTLGLPSDTPLVLHVGRFSAQKNHPGLLGIFARVQQHLPHAALLLVGDGPLKEDIVAQIDEWGLTDSVHLLGMRDDVAEIMTLSDVLLFPSFHEGLPVVALESCACELPFVGSDIPGTNEAIIHGETGLLHPVEDESALAAAVEQVLQQPAYADSLRVNARERIDKLFSRQASATALVQLYQDTLQTHAQISTSYAPPDG